MRIKLICVVSLLLNVALAGYWLKDRGDMTGHVAADAPTTTVPAVTPGPRGPDRRAMDVPNIRSASPRPLPWSRIESTDYPTFISHLRATGCPERTIRDIVVPEIDRHYAAPPDPLPDADDFWLSRNVRDTRFRSRRLEQHLREGERRDLLRTLLGVEGNWPKSRHASPNEWSGLCALLSPPTFETAESLAWVIDRMEFDKEGIELSAGHPLKVSEIEELKRLRDATFAQAVSLVGRERMDQTLGFFRVVMVSLEELRLIESEDPALRFPESELRRLIAAQPRDMTVVDEIYDFEDVTRLERFRAGLSKDTSDDLKAQFLDSLVQALGEARARELRLRAASDWSEVAEFIRENQLPETTTGMLVEARGFAETETERIRQDSALTAEEEAERLREIAEALRDSLQGAMPSEIWAAYLKSHGGWIITLENGGEDTE